MESSVPKSSQPEIPRTHEEFVESLQEMEDRRIRMADMIMRKGLDPLEDPHFNFLLGKIHVTQGQVIAGTVEQAVEAIEATEPTEQDPNIDN